MNAIARQIQSDYGPPPVPAGAGYPRIIQVIPVDEQQCFSNAPGAGNSHGCSEVASTTTPTEAQAKQAENGAGSEHGFTWIVADERRYQRSYRVFKSAWRRVKSFLDNMGYDNLALIAGGLVFGYGIGICAF